MSDHLPECPYQPEIFSRGQFGQPCICDRLLACEQRVREEERALICVEQTALAELNAEYRKGVQAARDAVDALYDRHDASCDEPRCEGPDREFALAAIDALRGESNG